MMHFVTDQSFWLKNRFSLNFYVAVFVKTTTSRIHDMILTDSEICSASS
jgi:hypothetical protein